MSIENSNSEKLSRRQMLLQSGSGFGALALAGLLQQDSAGATQQSAPSPLAAKMTHHPAKAKSVIFLFMDGGPSHLDTFDPKPALEKLAGKPIPESFGRVITAMGEFDSPILPSAAEMEAARRKWAVDLRLVAAHRKAGRRTGGDSLLLDERHQPFRRHLPDEHGQPVRRSPVARQLGDVRAGNGKRKPAGVRRHAGRSRASHQRSAKLGRGVHARGLSGHDDAEGRSAVCESESTEACGVRSAASGTRLPGPAQSTPRRKPQGQHGSGSPHPQL